MERKGRVTCVTAHDSLKKYMHQFTGRPYTREGLLVCDGEVPPIVECNMHCRCGVGCGNRVVQRGVTLKLQVCSMIVSVDAMQGGVYWIEQLKLSFHIMECCSNGYVNTRCLRRLAADGVCERSSISPGEHL